MNRNRVVGLVVAVVLAVATISSSVVWHEVVQNLLVRGYLQVQDDVTVVGDLSVSGSTSIAGVPTFSLAGICTLASTENSFRFPGADTTDAFFATMIDTLLPVQAEFGADDTVKVTVGDAGLGTNRASVWVVRPGLDPQ